MFKKEKHVWTFIRYYVTLTFSRFLVSFFSSVFFSSLGSPSLSLFLLLHLFSFSLSSFFLYASKRNYSDGWPHQRRTVMYQNPLNQERSVNPNYFDFSKRCWGVPKLTVPLGRVLYVIRRNCVLMCVLCDVRIVSIDEETSGCVRSLVCFPIRDERLPLESCELQWQHFSLQRALHAGVFETVVFFFDVQEESLGSARDLAFWSLWDLLIPLGSRDADSDFHLHLVLDVTYEAFLQHLVGLVLSSRPNMVFGRFEIWRFHRESWGVGGQFAVSLRQFRVEVELWRDVPLTWRSPCQSTLSSSGYSNDSRVCDIQTMSTSQWQTQNAVHPRESSYLVSCLAFGDLSAEFALVEFEHFFVREDDFVQS